MGNVQTQPKKPRRKLRKRWVVLIVLFILLAAAAGGAYAARKTLTSPAVGNVVSTLPPVTRDSDVELQQYDGTAISFVEPMTYIEQAGKGQQLPNQIESHTFISSGVVSKVVTVTVSKLPSGRLEDDSSYYMRTQNPAKYKMKAIVVKNETVVIFRNTDTQQYQQTAFWAHAGKLLTFNMSGVANDIPGMTQEFNDMVNSVTWR